MIDNVHYEAHHSRDGDAFDFVDICDLALVRKPSKNLAKNLTKVKYKINKVKKSTSMACFIALIIRSLRTSLNFSANN